MIPGRVFGEQVTWICREWLNSTWQVLWREGRHGLVLQGWG